MLGILIAAGMGRRLKAVTVQTPKCLVPMNPQGKTMLAQTLDNFWAVGCTECIIITGHAQDAFQQIQLPENVRFLHNADYRNNNILHSLMTAREFFDRPLLISYSDIWVEPFIYQQLIHTEGDAVLTVDTSWQDYYQGRDEHPIEQAEKVLYSAVTQDQAQVIALGKVLPESATKSTNQDNQTGEFLGLMKLSATAAKQFRKDFLALDERLNHHSPFQQAASWQQAYLTDLIQYQLEHGQPYSAALVAKGWAEFDTVQDYQRLPLTAKLQQLKSLENPSPISLD